MLRKAVSNKGRYALVFVVRSLLFIASAMPPLLVNAAQFYRWVDEEGQVYIQNYIPPEFVKKGYEIIDDRGKVVKTVAPEVSEEERRAKEALLISQEMQQARDDELLKLYRSPDDVDRAMNTWLSRMDMEIRVKQNSIRIKRHEFDKLQEAAANLEKAGREVDPKILEKMADIEQEIARYDTVIGEVEKRKAESKSGFLDDRARMVVLWEQRNNKTWVDEPAPEKESAP